MQLVTTYLSCKNVVYDEELLLPLLTEATNLLMPTSVEEIENLQSQVHIEDLFHTATTNVGTIKNLVSRKLVEFCSYFVDAKNCKCALFWWQKEQFFFPTIVTITQHILGIPTNQIETKHIFSIATILTTCCKCHLQIDNMDKLVFVNRNWPYDLGIGCSKPNDSTFVYEMEFDHDL
jgi:hypothetical protein